MAPLGEAAVQVEDRSDSVTGSGPRWGFGCRWLDRGFWAVGGLGSKSLGCREWIGLVGPSRCKFLISGHD